MSRTDEILWMRKSPAIPYLLQTFPPPQPTAHLELIFETSNLDISLLLKP